MVRGKIQICINHMCSPVFKSNQKEIYKILKEFMSGWYKMNGKHINIFKTRISIINMNFYVVDF